MSNIKTLDLSKLKIEKDHSLRRLIEQMNPAMTEMFISKDYRNMYNIWQVITEKSKNQDLKELPLIEKLSHENKKLRELIDECRLQIEYMHHQFKPTGTGNSLLSRIESVVR